MVTDVGVPISRELIGPGGGTTGGGAEGRVTGCGRDVMVASLSLANGVLEAEAAGAGLGAMLGAFLTRGGGLGTTGLGVEVATATGAET